MLSGGKDDSGRTRSPHAAGGAKDLTDAPCSSGGQSAATRASSRRDVVLGPLVLLGGGEWAASEPDAFNGHGYKVPVTLPGGLQATLSVPKSLRGRVGLVFSMPAQGVLSGGACEERTHRSVSPRAPPRELHVEQVGRAVLSLTVADVPPWS